MSAGAHGRPIVIVPARAGSTRFPEKVLAAETGRPLIVHVCEAAAGCGAVDRVVVATDDERVQAAAARAGFEAIITETAHSNGTSRIAEAAAILGLRDDDEIVNVQGDEPEIEPGAIVEALEALRTCRGADIGTVASPFAADEDPSSADIVKVVLAAGDEHEARRALYFSRALIPRGGTPLKHAGLYAYTAGFVRWYARQAPTPLERAERLEQLRALELGRSIGVGVHPVRWHGIDTRGDYDAFLARWRERGG